MTTIGTLIGGVIAIVIGVSIMPSMLEVIKSTSTTASLNVTGSSSFGAMRSLLDLVPIIMIIAVFIGIIGTIVSAIGSDDDNNFVDEEVEELKEKLDTIKSKVDGTYSDKKYEEWKRRQKE